MDKMKTQDVHLAQASGDTTSTINDQSSVAGTTPTTNITNSQGTASQEAKRPSWQGQQVHKSGTIYTHSYVQNNKHMYDWILLDTFSLIDLFCNQSFVHNVHQVNTTLSLATNAGMMMTNLKAELPGMAWYRLTLSHDKCAEFWQYSQTVSHLISTRIGYISSSIT